MFGGREESAGKGGNFERRCGFDALGFDENGDIILIDYKTDEVELDNYEYVLKNRYENQLKYYKEACDKMFKKPVSKVYLYSVKLNKKVELQL